MRSIIDECYQGAHQILEENRKKLDVMAEALMQYETIDAEQIDDIMNDREPRPPADWGDSGSSQSDGDDSSSSTDSVGPIGDPAGEH